MQSSKEQRRIDKYLHFKDELFYIATNDLLNQDQKSRFIYSEMRKFFTELTCLELLDIQQGLK